MSRDEDPPSLLESLDRTPVTVGAVACAIAVTIARETQHSIGHLVMDDVYFYTQPWRLFTSALPHGGVLHLFFNVWWTWTLGRALEVRLGRLRTLALFLVIAGGSAAAEFAFMNGGIGLSGVVYGLAGYLWTRGRRDPEYRLLDRRTIELLGVWFLLCIVLTYTGSMPIANFAHGFGALIGAVLGLGWRWVSAGVLVLCLALAGPLRPWVNFSADGLYIDYRHGAMEAFADERWARGVELSEAALERGDDSAVVWHNYGVGLRELGRMQEALRAFGESEARGGVD